MIHVPGTRVPGWAIEVVRTALASLAIALLAQLSIPIGPVPISGQTLAVLGAAWTLGRARGSAAVAFYLAYGAMGLPVFAGGTAGPLVVMGPTGGYLAGFLVSAYAVGCASDRMRGTGYRNAPAAVAAVTAVGTALIYACGVVWLSRFVGWDRVIAVGVTPFLIGDAIKIGLLAALLPAVTVTPRRR